MTFLNTEMVDYLQGAMPARDPVLQEMEAYAGEVGFPIIGPQSGQVLFQLARISRPSKIFEMGSGFGYSAHWLLKGSPGASIVCTETRDENIKRAEDWLGRAGLWDRVTYHCSTAQEVLAGRDEPVDFIFNDVDKHQYPEVFSLAMDHLNPGGILVTDNMLWHGQVADPGITDDSTEGIRSYIRMMYNTEGVISSIVPTGDGLGISIKGV